MTLILICVAIPFQIPKLLPSTVWEFPFVFLVTELSAEERIDLFGARNDLFQLLGGAAEENSIRIRSVSAPVLKPVADRALSLSPAPRAAVADLEDWAGDEVGLRAWLWSPGDVGISHSS
jgi:hypothetical protein